MSSFRTVASTTTMCSLCCRNADIQSNTQHPCPTEMTHSILVYNYTQQKHQSHHSCSILNIFVSLNLMISPSGLRKNEYCNNPVSILNYFEF